MNETQLLHAFMAAVPRTLHDVRVFRRNIINGQLTTGQRVRNGIKGQADAYAMAPGARYVEIETKSATGRLTPEQAAWRAFCERLGFPYLLLAARRDELPDQTVTRWIDELRRVL